MTTLPRTRPRAPSTGLASAALVIGLLVPAVLADPPRVEWLHSPAEFITPDGTRAMLLGGAPNPDFPLSIQDRAKPKFNPGGRVTGIRREPSASQVSVLKQEVDLEGGSAGAHLLRAAEHVAAAGRRQMESPLQRTAGSDAEWTL